MSHWSMLMRNKECGEHMWKVLGKTLTCSKQTAAFLLVVVGLDRRPLGQLELTHDSHQFMEGLVYIHPQLGTALDVRNLQLS